MNTPLPVRHLARLAGQFGAALGAGLSASIVLGWLTHAYPLLLQYYDGPPMVFSVAVTNLLVGVLLLVWRVSPHWRAALLRALGALVIALGAWSLLEITTGHNLGLDFPAMHAAVQMGNPQPGRASPFTGVAFVLLGLALSSLGAPRWPRLVGLTAIVALGAIGAGGLLAYALQLYYLNLWPRQTGLAATTALVLFLYALALAAQRSRAAGGTVALTPVQRIHLLAVTVLAGVSLFVGVVGLVAMQRQVQVAQDRTIDALLNDRQRHMSSDINVQLGRARYLADGMTEAAIAGMDLSVVLRREALQWLDEDVRCAQILGQDGIARSSVGECASAAAPALTVQAIPASRLVVDHGDFLESTYPLTRGSRVFGALRVQLPLRRVSEMLAMSVPWEGARLTLCGADLKGTACLGSRAMHQNEMAAAATPFEWPSGAQPQDVFSPDAKGATVLTRWTAVGQTGLELGLSVPSQVLYGPARSGMQFMSVFLVFAVALGAVAIYRGIRPLTSELDAARQLAAENLELFRSASDSAQEGITLLKAVRDSSGLICDFEIVYVNDAGLRLLGMSMMEVLGHRLLELAKAFPNATQNLARYREVVETGVPALMESPCFASAQAPVWISRNITKVRDGVMVVARDITESRREAQRLADSALVDGLTGLLNERAARARLAAACEAAQISGAGVAVAYCDLDDFKAVNDRWGHGCGDELLVCFARTLQAAVRHTDVVARLHGDEFVVVLEYITAPEEVHKVVQDLRAALDHSVEACGALMELRASVGVAYAAGADADMVSLLNLADADMYREKLQRKARKR